MYNSEKELWNMKKSVKIGIALVVMAALAAVALHPVTGIVFDNLTAPTAALEIADPWEGGTAYTHVQYGEDSDAQWLNLYVPDTEEPAPLLILVHGGGFILNDAESRQAQLMYSYFRDNGFACATVNYRLADEALYPAAIEDVKAAVRFLGQMGEEYGCDVSRTAIWGESAGAFLACMTALTSPEEYSDARCVGESEDVRFPEVTISALVDYYGPANMADMNSQFQEQGIPSFIRAISNTWLTDHTGDFDSCEEYWVGMAYAGWTEEMEKTISVYWQTLEGDSGNTGLKTMLIHGTSDLTVAHAQSEQLAEAVAEIYGADSVTLKLVEHCKHADDRLYSNEILGEVRTFLLESFDD